MKKISAILLTILFLGVLSQRPPESIEQPDDSQPKRPLFYPEHLQVPNCVPGFPYFSVGDMIIADSNYTKVIRSTKLLVIVATQVLCKACCKHEVFYANLKNYYLNDKNSNPFANETKMARIEIGDNPEFMQNYFPMKRVPYILVFFDRKPYYYNDVPDYAKIMRFIQRFKEPIYKANNLASLEKWLTRTEVDFNGNAIQTMKVVGFFYDPEETAEDREEFKEAVERSMDKTEVYFAMMTNKKEIKKAQKKYGEQWFELFTLTSVVIQYYPGKYRIVDISTVMQKREVRLRAAIQQEILKPVDEFADRNYKFYQKKNIPMLVFVIDTVVNWEESRKQLRIIEGVARDFLEKVHFTWVEGQFNPEKRGLLGITHDKIPAMAFFRIDFENKVAWPKEWPINAVTIREFVKDYLSKPIDAVVEKYERNQKKLKRSSIYTYLRSSIELGEKNYTSFLEENEASDVLVLFFDSRRDHHNTSVALNFNHILKRFQNFQFNSVLIAIYDIFYQEKLPFIESDFSEMFVILYPAHQKRDSYLKFTEEIKAEKLMKFVENNSQGRIVLPDLPHIPEDKLDDYLAQQASDSEFNEDKFLAKDEL